MPFLKNEGVELYYEVAGDGPPILLINGLAGDTRQWEPLVSRLKNSFQVVSFDMRCAGRSDKPDVPFSVEDVAEDAYALVRHLGYDKVTVLGFSMGGMIAMKLVLAHKELISKMFLVATALHLFKGVGHMVPLEVPQKLADIVLNFSCRSTPQ